jgi:hypothetical protein
MSLTLRKPNAVDQLDLRGTTKGQVIYRNAWVSGPQTMKFQQTHPFDRFGWQILISKKAISAHFS